MADPVVLAIDVGGSHVKALTSNQTERLRFESGPKLTPAQMVAGVREVVAGWPYDVVSVGIPTPVRGGRALAEPINLGKGWVGFDFDAAFGKPTKVVNDAVMQAIGSYEGGRMLFLGFGTGLGSALIVEGVVEPLELGHLPFRKKTFEDYISERALRKRGRKRWAAAELQTRRQRERLPRRLPALGFALDPARGCGYPARRLARGFVAGGTPARNSETGSSVGVIRALGTPADAASAANAAVAAVAARQPKPCGASCGKQPPAPGPDQEGKGKAACSAAQRFDAVLPRHCSSLPQCWRSPATPRSPPSRRARIRSPRPPRRAERYVERDDAELEQQAGVLVHRDVVGRLVRRQHLGVDRCHSARHRCRHVQLRLDELGDDAGGLHREGARRRVRAAARRHDGDDAAGPVAAAVGGIHPS